MNGERFSILNVCTYDLCVGKILETVEPFRTGLKYYPTSDIP